MTHSWGTHLCARPFMSPFFCQSTLFRFALKMSMHLAHVNHGSWNDVVDLRGAPREVGAKRRLQYALDRNFGELEFDWNRRELVIRGHGQEVGGAPLLSTAWSFDALSGATPLPEPGHVTPSDYQTIYRELSEHGAKEEDWICVQYNGRLTSLRKLYGFLSPAALLLSILVAPVVIPLLLVYYCFLRPRRIRKKNKIKVS